MVSCEGPSKTQISQRYSFLKIIKCRPFLTVNTDHPYIESGLLSQLLVQKAFCDGYIFIKWTLDAN